MILSPREAEAVTQVASSYNVAGNPEELIDDALQAICTGGADEAAYLVAYAGGVGFIGQFIWFKDRRKVLTAEQARALITQAKQDQTYEGPIPEDDGKAIEEANALVDLATDAWNDMVRGSEVETILRMAAQFEDGDGAEPAEPAEKIPPEEQVQDARPDLAQTAAAAFRTDDLQDLAKTEPWEDYGTEKVSDIIDGINAAIDGYSLEELYELLRNIWAYESSHRNRKTVLDAVEEVHTQIVEKQREAGQTPYAPPNQIPRPVQEPEAGAEGGQGDGAEAPVADREPEPDAQAEPEPEAAEPVPEGPADEAEPVPEAAGERPAGEDTYEGLIAEVEEAIGKERLHVPEPPTEAAPQLPWDWTKISDTELQRLHSVFYGFAYYTDYRLAQQSRIALACKQAADELSRELLVAASKYDDKGKEVKVTFLEAEIEADPNVKEWRKRQRRHDAFASALRSERDSYFKILEGLSRHESMRQNEWQRAGSKPGGILRRAGGK